MMWDFEPQRILVGLETDECEAALAYAAREARLRGCGVHLVHVVPMLIAGGTAADAVVMRDGELYDPVRRILGDAAINLEHLLRAEDLPVSTEVCHGPVEATLIEESRRAALVVLQHRGMGPDGRPPLLSVTARVAARAHAPVVAVPAGWSEPGATTQRIVTVGIGDGSENDHLIGVAADEAARLGATLRIVHAEDDLTLEELVQEVPTGPADYIVGEGEPADALLARADDTTLFVVGRRRPRLPLGHRLGSTARTLLRRSPVPVMVVDPCDSKDRRDLATAAIP